MYSTSKVHGQEQMRDENTEQIAYWGRGCAVLRRRTRLIYTGFESIFRTAHAFLGIILTIMQWIRAFGIWRDLELKGTSIS